MVSLLKNWKLTLLALALIVSLLLIFWPTSHPAGGYVPYTNIKLGLDFSGGTLYQIELQKPITTDEINRIATILKQRIDPLGLQDAAVNPIGNQLIEIQLSETNPVELEKIESRIRQQGKFEATLSGEIVFTGDEIQKVLRGDNSYGVSALGANAYQWSLPFILNDAAANRFMQKTFHQCSATSFSTTGTPTYTCEKTIFFLDKPNAVILTTEDTYSNDSSLLQKGNQFENIPAGTSIDLLALDSNLPVITFDQNKGLNLSSVSAYLPAITNVVVSPDVPKKTVEDLNALGFTVLTVSEKKDVPWIWTAMGARQIISLTEGITNEDVPDISQAKLFSTLRITGQRATIAEARSDLEELAILLDSGSLPTPVKTISRETISPSLGEAFLSNVIMMGILAMITVAVVIIIRYRLPKLVVPIFLTGMSEIVIMLGFLALPGVNRPLDLAAFAGLIAAIGTGIDSEIVITDEMLGKTTGSHESLNHRAKSALFIIGTSAFTIVAVMGPIVLTGRTLPGIDKLMGFAIVTIIGTLIGIFITRPGFTKILEGIVHKKETSEYNKAHEEQK